MRSVELFAGAGGLALGVARAGFSHDAIVERDADACATLLENQHRGVFPASRIFFDGSIEKFDYSQIEPGLDLLAGGPPCQPFSIGGKHRGREDERNLFPQAVRAVRELQPKAFMFENVRGLLRESFAKYFEYIILQLTYPEVTIKSNEEWEKHLSRLERYHTSGKPAGLHYRVVFRLLNAADFGVPQRRARVFIVGFRSDIGHGWSFPDSTHSQDALHYSQWISAEYWDRHQVAKRNRPSQTRAGDAVSRLFPPLKKPWRTVRDAISDLPGPQSPRNESVNNHTFMAGARAYPGHTGSSLDEAAKTLKAGDHGVPGGENMLRDTDGSVRYFTVRESARLQTFPDEFVFKTSWTESMRQLGNAVPVVLSNVVAHSIKKHLERVRRPER